MNVMDNNIITEELLEKIKSVKSAEEMMALAKENGIEISAEDAEKYYVQLAKTGELSDDELDNVSGGACSGNANLLTTIINIFQGNAFTTKPAENLDNSPSVDTTTTAYNPKNAPTPTTLQYTNDNKPKITKL